MKLVAKLLIVALAISHGFVMTANASPAGSTCKKLGANKKVKKAEFICTKVGKKRVWVKVKLPVATPIPTPLPTPAPSTSPSPSPTPTKVPQYLSAREAKVGADCSVNDEYSATLDGPVSCEGVWTLIPKEKDSVASRAYRYVLGEYLKNSEGDLSIIWRIDPTTPEWKNQIQTGMVAGARLWGTSPAGSPPRYVFVSHKSDWLFDQFVKDGLIKNEFRRATMFQGSCNAGLTGSDTSDSSFWFYKFDDINCTTNVGFFQVPAHEYTHYAQEVLSKNRWNKVKKVAWLDEGLPSFIGGALGPMSGMPNNLRSMWAMELNRVVRDLAFYNVGIGELLQESRWNDVFPLGAIAMEAMVASIGFEKTKQIYIELSYEGTTYEEAITKVTGVGISGWNSIMQGYVDSVKSTKPWTLDYLLSEYTQKKAS